MRTMRYATTFILMAGLILAALTARAQDEKATGDESKEAETPTEAPAEAPAEQERWTGEGISWAVPEGWTQEEGQGPRFATLHAGEGDERVEISVTVFPGTVGGKLANVNRWRGQIGLDPIDEGELADKTTEIEVDGEAATLVDFTGTDEDSKRLVAAMIRRGERTWFVKALGPSAAVGAQREAIEQFVTSIEFGDGEGGEGEGAKDNG